MPYENHPSAGDLPNPDMPVWRFVSLSKYLSLLTTSSLYFSQVHNLRRFDPFEGSLAELNRQFYELMETDQQFARRFLNLGDDKALPSNLRSVFSLQQAATLQSIFSATTYINCWHISSEESAFLWSNYSSITEGLAIRSTIGKLCESLNVEERPIYIGPVKYIDYMQSIIPQGNAFNAFFYKRRSFEPERELRCCFSHLVEGVGWSARAVTENPKGIQVNCDLSVLIQEVYVSPFAEPWFEDLIRGLHLKLKVELPVRKSTLMDKAIL